MYEIINPAFKKPNPFPRRLDPDIPTSRYRKHLVDVMESSDKKIVFIPMKFLSWDEDIEATVSEAKKYTDVDCFIVDGSPNWYPLEDYESRKNIFRTHGINNFIILSGHGHHLDHGDEQTFYYPVPWMQTQTRVVRLPDTDHKKKYIFSSLNGIARLHRVILAEMALQKPYLERCCFSFNDRGEVIGQTQSIWEQRDHGWAKYEYLNDKDQQLLDRARQFLPYRNADIPLYNWDEHSNRNPAYSDSYVNIITETGYQETYWSEKTFKAIASGQFFISINGPGSIRYLKHFGFDTFDDIIDHSYDEIQDPYEKIQAIGKLMDDIVDLDWPRLWEQTRERRLKNVEHFFSDSYHKWLKPVEQRLKIL